VGIPESYQNPREGAAYCLALRGTSFHVVVISVPEIHPPRFCREHRYPPQGNRTPRTGPFLDSPFSHTGTINNYRRAIRTRFAGAALLCAINNTHPFHYVLKDACACCWKDLTLIPETTLLLSIACFLAQVCVWDTAYSCDDVPEPAEISEFFLYH